MGKAEGFLRAREGAEFLGIGESMFWDLAKNDTTFPTPMCLGPRVTLFSKQELESWALSKKGTRGGSRRGCQKVNCTICVKPIVLVPSAAERAAKHGNTPAFYTGLFRQHADCQLKARAESTSGLMRGLRK